MRDRVTAFFKQLEQDQQSGARPKLANDVSLGFAIQLHTSLRQMLLHIVQIKDPKVKLFQLRQIYEWFFHRLVSIGALSRDEINAEVKFLNPMTDALTESFKRAVGRKTQ